MSFSLVTSSGPTSLRSSLVTSRNICASPVSLTTMSGVSRFGPFCSASACRMLVVGNTMLRDGFLPLGCFCWRGWFFIAADCIVRYEA